MVNVKYADLPPTVNCRRTLYAAFDILIEHIVKGRHGASRWIASFLAAHDGKRTVKKFQASLHRIIAPREPLSEAW